MQANPNRPTVVLITCLLAMLSTRAAGQVADLPTPSPLPVGAVARLGSVGDTNRLHGVYGIRFSPQERFIATLTSDQVIRVYDAINGRLLAELDGYEEGRVADFVFSADGTLLLVVSNDNEPLIIWNVESGRRERVLDLVGHRLYRSPIPDEFILLQQDRVLGFSLDREQEPTTKYLVHNRPQAVPLSLSPDGKHVLLYLPPPANAGSRHKLSLHEVATSQDVDFSIFELPIMRAVFSPTTDEIAIICRNGTHVHLRHTTDNRRENTLLGNGSLVRDVCYSPDGRELVAVGTDGTVRVWECDGPALHDGRRSWRSLDHGGFRRQRQETRHRQCGLERKLRDLWDWRELLFPNSNSTLPPMPDLLGPLGSRDPTIAYRTMGAIVRSGDRGVRAIKSLVLEVIKPVSVEAVASLVDKLDDPSFAVRDTASRRLLVLRDVARRELVEAFHNARSTEMRLRLRRLLSEHVQHSSMTGTERRSWQRAVYVLEVVGTDAATDLLSRIAKGHPDRILADQAATAAERAGKASN